jgi:hypothetical protein
MEDASYARFDLLACSICSLIPQVTRPSAYLNSLICADWTSPNLTDWIHIDSEQVYCRQKRVNYNQRKGLA